MGEVTASVSTSAQNLIDSKIMCILNPTMHHHDLLQSYVRVPVESTSNSKQFEDVENFNKAPSSLGTCLDTESVDDIDKESRIDEDIRKKKNNKKQQKNKSSKLLSVEPEMSIRKRKK
ncbi:hypothetical protein WN48_07688 [Eufriesea mexicana]|uniref:Uncharacterized protein n=1 Tax=Eufriesea mexicana TaxID=516756 RepID=A0A310SJ35_9HYME|nr:PREDICTED: uncharacterized protein LOC108545863 [Eufriesea mexicana]OAD62621.1 hypothetical protein WN48_07688 [Eufriesea mexicana]